MNSYPNWPKTSGYSSSPIIRYGRRFVLQSIAFCNAAAVGLVILLVISAPALAAPPCATPPCGGGGGKPITISLSQDMAFGTLAPDVAISGTAVIDPSTGIKTVTGGVFDFGGVHMPAIFAVTGDKNTAFTITLSGAVTLTSGGNSMTLNSFTSSPAVGLLDNTGKADVTVGGTLQVGANQPAGTYSGLFDVTVNY